MPKQLNISLGFSADTSQAKTQIQGLITELNRIGSISHTSFRTDTLTSNINEAKMAAKQLGQVLDDAFNADVGKLDLNKLNTSLKQSGMTLTEYGNKLARLGPTGNAAFLKVAQSIIETEAPLRRSGKLLQEFGTTLANTARWQISSSILHGFMGSVQKAYGYAQSLDKSLNNIRIVTGQSAEQMAAFAEKANKAAKALSTTTTEYTNASLIYYQQGLSDSEVQARTDVTIKMANAAGQSAEIVSDQLTAVWNNFYDGSKSLEYYADVMTALGAATASSTDEIAGGLEKFAAIGETIGLSYEYAASALATITSNTRQSEEVVGTALKTLFARIQGLSLGETLEDGVDLNKYSEALKKVGISIFDSVGELRNMDDILDDMAGKWGTLSKAQQTALAQTVAGVRQYTQLVALMENWDNGDNDSMIANLDTAYGASGALQEQADIYAESWEASKDRVQAALEGVYDSILDEDFFTGVNDGFASMLGGVEMLVNSLGGMPGILSLIGVIGTRIFENQIASGINNALHSLKNFTGVSMVEMRQLKKEAYEYAMAMTNASDSPTVGAQREHLKRVYELQIKTEEALRGVNEEQAEAIKKAYELAKGYSEVAVEAAKAQEAAKQDNFNIQQRQSDKYGKGASKKIADSTDIAVGLAGADLIKEAKTVESFALEMGNAGKKVSDLQNAIQNYRNVLKETPEDQGAVSRSAMALIEAMEGVGTVTQTQGEAFAAFQSVLDQAALEFAEAENAYNELQASLVDSTPTADQAQQIETLALKLQELGLPIGPLIGQLKQYHQVMNSNASEQDKAKALAALGAKFKNCTISTEAAIEGTKKYALQLLKGSTNAKTYTKILKQMGDKLNESVKGARNAAKTNINYSNTVDEAKKKVEQYAETLKKAKDSVNSFGSGAAKAIQGVSSLGMAMSSLSGMWDTLTNPDASGFEKLVAVMTSSGMVVSSLTSGISGLGEGFKKMKAFTDASNGSLLAQAMQLKTNEIQQNSWLTKIREKLGLQAAEQAADTQSITTKGVETGVIIAGGEAQEEYNEEKEEGVIATTASAVSSGVDTAAKSAEAVATTTAGTAQTFLNTTLTPFIALMGAALVAVLPYIAAAAALAAVVAAVAYAVTEESRALKEAEEREQRAADAAQRVSDEINEINQALNNIDSKTDSLKNLEKGSREWQQALAEVNAEINAIIEKFPELLEMGAIIKDPETGLLSITEEGLDYIAQENAKKQAISGNIDLAAKRNTVETKKDNLDNDYSSSTFSNTTWALKWEEHGYSGTVGNYKTQAEAEAAQTEKNKEIGSPGYTVTSSTTSVNLSDKQKQAIVDSYKTYGDSMFTDDDILNTVVQNAQAADTSVDLSAYTDQLKTWITTNEEIISQQGEYANQIDAINRQMIEGRLSAYGSNRTAEQALDLMGTDEWYSVSGTGNNRAVNYTKEDGTKTSFDMNKHVNYAANDLPEEIQKFMEMQGDDVEYVAQRQGKLVLKIGDEEKEFSENEVYDAIGEIYAVETMEKAIRDNLTAAYGNALSGVSELDTTELVQLDNLYLGLEEAIGTGENQKAQVDTAFQNIVNAYGTGQANLEALAADTKFIDMQSAAFQQLVTNTQITGEQLKGELQKLNALGEIETMGSWFKDQADSMGMGDEEAKDMQEYAKHLLRISEASGEVGNDLAKNAKGAAALAVQIARMNKGIDTLAGGFEDWNDVLQNSDRSSFEYSKALSGMSSALADVLGVEEEYINEDFVTEHLDKIKKAAEGDEVAIENLRGILQEDIIAKITVDNQLEDKGIDLIASVQTLQEALDAEFPDGITMGAQVTTPGFVDALNQMIADAGMTADQVNTLLSTMNCTATFASEPQKIETKIPEYTTYHRPGKITWQTIDDKKVPVWEETSWTEQTGEHVATGEAAAFAMTTDGSVPKVETVSGIADASNSNYSSSNSGGPPPGGSSGGGGSKGSSKSDKPKKAEALKEDDVIERYKETDAALDDVAEAYDDASKAADRLYGAGRIAAMAKANAQLLKEIGLLKKKKKEAQEYLKLDKAAVDMAAAEAGVTLQYDANGNIVNYTHELSHLVQEYKDLVEVINEDNDVSDEEQEQLDEKKKKIDDLTESIEKYEQTQEQIEEIDNEIRDKFYEWQDNNFEMWSHSLEVSIDITDDFKEVLDILMTRTEGDFYKQAEGLALMGGQLALVNVEMGSYIGHLGMLGGLMATGSISPADFVEGLGQVKDGAFAAAQAIFELDQQMIEYYGNALAMAREEIDLYTDQLAQCTSVLEHYLSLMDLMGHQTDYKKRGIVLEGRVKTLKNELDALQMEADYMQEEADKKKRMLDRAILPTSAEVFKQQYEDALSAAMETQEEFLAKAEEYAEALNEQLENSLNAANQDLEDALTGGTSFDQMITGMERLVSLEEEYLTTTNKIYETEKLMNKAQQEIDKTTNTIAKQRLKQFIAETEQLQEKSKLSKFELDVQQAKYDLLLAEIALEEAQNAKSQVRLQRDREGNFGYVYTADASAISDAEQELADRQNEFYNIALEGINTYAEKYAQTLEEMYDTLTEIDQQYHEGAFASEAEYLAAREAAISYYFEKLGQYSELYNIAIQLDSKATEEAWGSDYRQMVNSTDQWKTAVTTHATQVTAAFKVWGNAMDVLADQTKLKMDQLAGSVKKVTDESDALAEELENEVMPKIKAEMSLVSQLTALYAALRIVVLGLAYAYMALGVAMTFCQMAASMGSMLGAIDFSGAADVVSQGASALGGAATSTKSSGGTTTTTSDTKSSSGYKKGDTIHIDKGDDVYDYKGAAREGASYTGDYKILEDLGDGWYSYGTGGKETGKVYRPEKYNTGGYTGEWGSYGKLAMLHEKELVLNAKDTENFLASMDLLDNIVSTIDLHTANQSLGKALNSPGLGSVGSETLEQTVTIEANFPGVSSRTEIEEAFSTLVNRASQYANRK